MNETQRTMAAGVPPTKTANLRFTERTVDGRTLRILQQEVIYADHSHGWVDVPLVTE